MEGQDTRQRAICLRSSDRHFFLAVNKPFSERGDAYNRFVQPAEDVRMLDEGSQVFIYRREEFNYGYEDSPNSDTKTFSEFAWATALDLGGLAINPIVESVHNLEPPAHFISV